MTGLSKASFLSNRRAIRQRGGKLFARGGRVHRGEMRNGGCNEGKREV